MADGFEAMVVEARSFFTELTQNNSKDWFDPRKAHYTDAIRKPAELFADLISQDLGRLSGRSHKAKMFRIYRDVRFSKDKTPLNAHLHIMWSDVSGDPLTPGWYWGLSPDYFIVGGGLTSMGSSELATFRAHIDRDGDRISDALKKAEAHGVTLSDWGPDPLKRVPKPYASDHPHGDLLRRKSLTYHVPMPEDWEARGVVAATLDRVKQMMPLAESLKFE